MRAGLSVSQHLPRVELTGIDATVEMLAKARDKVTEPLFAPLAGWTGW